MTATLDVSGSTTESRKSYSPIRANVRIDEANLNSEIGPIVVKRSTTSDIFRGTADQIVAAGLAKLSELPGQPGVGSTQASYAPEGSRIEAQGTRRAAACPGSRIIRKSGKSYTVELMVSESVRNQREIEQEKARQRAMKQSEMRKQAHRILKQTQTTAVGYFKEMSEHCTTHLGLVELFVNIGRVGVRAPYRLDDASTAKMLSLIRQSIEVINDAHVVIDEGYRQEQLDEATALLKEADTIETAPRFSDCPRLSLVATRRPSRAEGLAS